MNTPIYLDYAATTPTDPAVVAVMSRYLGPDGVFGNPASRFHSFGRDAEEAVEQARVHVAELINADPREIIWTSGATESDNLAIKGAVAAYADQGTDVFTSAIEHKAVLDSCRHLERKGFEVTRIEPGPDGLITPPLVEAALRDDTTLLPLMHVNKEIGTITDIESIGRLARRRRSAAAGTNAPALGHSAGASDRRHGRSSGPDRKTAEPVHGPTPATWRDVSSTGCRTSNSLPSTATARIAFRGASTCVSPAWRANR